MFGFSDVQFFISKIVPSPLKVVTPWVLAQEEEFFWIYFWIYLLNRISFGYKTGPVNIYSNAKRFRKYLEWFGSMGPKSRYLIYKPTAINRKPITMCLWFLPLLKVRTEAIKNSEHHLLLIYWLHYIAILSKYIRT